MTRNLSLSSCVFLVLALLVLAPQVVTAAEADAEQQVAEILPTPVVAATEAAPASQSLPAGLEKTKARPMHGGTCASNQLEVTCHIGTDPCGRTFSASGCCTNAEKGCCVPTVDATGCYLSLAVMCMPL